MNKFFNIFLSLYLSFSIIQYCFCESEDCWVHDDCGTCLSDPDCGSFCDWGLGQGYCEYEGCDQEQVVNNTNDCSDSTANCESFTCDECMDTSDCKWCDYDTSGSCFNPLDNENNEKCEEKNIADDGYDCKDPCEYEDCDSCVANECVWCADGSAETCKESKSCTNSSLTCTQSYDCSQIDNCADCVQDENCRYFENLEPSVISPNTGGYVGRCVNGSGEILSTEREVTAANECSSFSDPCEALISCENCISNENCQWCQVDNQNINCANNLFINDDSSICQESIDVCSTPTPDPTATKDAGNHQSFSLLLLILTFIVPIFFY
ncbi:hypothetical protein M0813_25563 [Anaeramoeba flamelloides]|uniref:Uncharacterized protein n=1 Tax=Anaeramoeba flamelloides TaxID=1746091 RepID=A0ABQ8Y2Z1_9EUKA|nr:hypothetical protein M0813_25563 [Anaeramoeba flamelloides]